MATWEKDDAKQKELFEKSHQENLKPHVEKVEAHLVKNGTGYLVGNAVIYKFISDTILEFPPITQSNYNS